MCVRHWTGGEACSVCIAGVGKNCKIVANILRSGELHYFYFVCGCQRIMSLVHLCDIKGGPMNVTVKNSINWFVT